MLISNRTNFSDKKLMKDKFVGNIFHSKEMLNTLFVFLVF